MHVLSEGLKFAAAQLVLVQKALQCKGFVLAVVLRQAFGSPPTARGLVGFGASRAREQPWKSVLSLDPVLTFGRAELLNTSCA